MFLKFDTSKKKIVVVGYFYYCLVVNSQVFVTRSQLKSLYAI